MPRIPKKKVSRLSLQQLKRFYAQYHGLTQERDELNMLLRERKEKAYNITSRMPPWAPLHELPFEKLLALFFVTFAYEEDLHRITSSSDPKETLLTFLESDPSSKIDDGDIDNDDDLERVSIFFALMHSIIGIEYFGKPIPTLLADFRSSNDDEQLLRAVTIDRTAVATPTAAKRIAYAQLIGDNGFMDKLSKAITQTKPARPAKKYDDLRYMAMVMNDSVDLENISFAEMHRVLADDFELYPTDTKDSLAGFKNIIKGLGIK